MILQVQAPPPPPFDPTLLFLNKGGGVVIVMIVLAALAAATIILWPIMRALARRLEGRTAGAAELRTEIDHLRQHLGEVDALQARVAELEERLDFAERLLAQSREPDRLQR